MTKAELERELKYKEELIQGQILELERLNNKIVQQDVMLEKSEKLRKEEKAKHKKVVQELINDVQKLNSELESQVAMRNLFENKIIEYEKSGKKPIHNERGAGRKPTISDEKIQMIHDLRNEGLTQKEIASKIGMSKATVNRILKINSDTADDSHN